jgi:hypothetical protein
MLLRHSLDLEEEADRVERAVRKVLADGLRTADSLEPGRMVVGARAMASPSSIRSWPRPEEGLAEANWRP